MERLEQLKPDYLQARSHTLRWFAEGGAITAISISAAILLIWLLQPAWVEPTAPFLLEMKVNSAVGYGAAGAALLMITLGWSRSARILALISLSGGILTTLTYAGMPLAIDEIIVRDSSPRSEPYPGRPSLNSAVDGAGESHAPDSDPLGLSSG